MRTKLHRTLRPLSAFALVAASGFGLCVSTARSAEVAPQPLEGKINWVYSYAEGKKLAAQTGKPIFLVFRCER